LKNESHALQAEASSLEYYILQSYFRRLSFGYSITVTDRFFNDPKEKFFCEKPPHPNECGGRLCVIY
jgi:hypothetical protein